MTVIDFPRSSPSRGGGPKGRRRLPRRSRRHAPGARQLGLAATLLIAIAGVQLLPDAPPASPGASEVPLPFQAGGPYWSTPRLTAPVHGGGGPSAEERMVEGASPTPGIEIVSASGGHAHTTGQVLSGRPTRITDGDTFTLAGARIRLAGIDAPEMSTAAGEPARRHLARLVTQAGGEVACQDTGERSYDRIVARCFTADGQDLAALMVEAGWARDWARFSGGRYAAAEQGARADGRGMYGG